MSESLPLIDSQEKREPQVLDARVTVGHGWKPTFRTTCHPCGWKRTLGVTPRHTIGQPSHRSTVAPRTNRSEKRHGRTTRATSVLAALSGPSTPTPSWLSGQLQRRCP
ncbi:hypothetical protein CEP54_006291 [Fusarium duplospermum]|uniref:Uncharacterized protein n=1 Tax=Fusarium duplospermum TaxID=1325734 RepID=A0A428Q7F5_9HYPO|nr:hypothetical protein CEP54_006291 [Fusarium duplospermum]